MNPFHTPQGIITLLICISVLVVAHEWGHFIVARIFGIRVDDFSVGFGKRLFRIAKLGNTEYNVRILPLGGFVKIHGMDADEEPLTRAKDQIAGKKNDPDARELPLVAENTPQADDDDIHGPDSFATKPLWQRSLVIFAGPLMSFLLGYVVLCLMGCVIGSPTGDYLNKVTFVQPDGEGYKIGLRTNDLIIGINGVPISNGNQMISMINNSVDQQLTFTIKRGSRVFDLKGTPRPIKDESGKVVLYATVTGARTFTPGIDLHAGDKIKAINNTEVDDSQQANSLFRANAGKPVDLDVIRGLDTISIHGTLPAAAGPETRDFVDTKKGILNFQPVSKSKRVSFRESVHEGNEMTLGFFMGLLDLVKHRQQLQKSAGEIIAIYQVTDLAAQLGVDHILLLYANVSLSLAVFNLLPIPVLDGGHLLAFFIEWVRRGQKFNQQQQQAFLLTGFAIIGVLVILVVYNDILRTIHHQVMQ